MRKARGRPVETLATADDYIDDLPIKEGGPSVREHVRGKSSANPPPVPDDDTLGAKGVVNGPAIVVGSLCAAALILCGWAVAALQYTVFSDRERDARVVTQPTAEVPAPIVSTKIVVQLPDSCRLALSDMIKYLNAAAAVGDANSRQLDIIDNAYQAIMMKDWKALNQVSEDQRKLATSLGPASSEVLPVLVQVRKEIDQCRSDAS